MTTPSHDDDHDPASAGSAPGPGLLARASWTLPLWKKALLAAAALMLIAGLGLRLAGFTGPATDRASSESRNVVSTDGEYTNPAIRERSLVDTETETQTIPFPRSPDEPGAEDRAENGEATGNWSPALVKGGLSFLVGFCIGYALRTFLKISAVILGICLLIIFGLSYIGAVQVDWPFIESRFDQFVTGVKDDFGQFRTFITGSLPAAGLAGLGLFTGFKRTR